MLSTCSLPVYAYSTHNVSVTCRFIKEFSCLTLCFSGKWPCWNVSVFYWKDTLCPGERIYYGRLQVTLLRQEGWTRWPSEVPSNPYHSVILRFCDIHFYFFLGFPLHTIFLTISVFKIGQYISPTFRFLLLTLYIWKNSYQLLPYLLRIQRFCFLC